MGKQKEMIYIPDYIVKTLELYDFSLEKLYDIIANETIVKDDVVIDKLLTMLTKSDIGVLVQLNKRMNKFLKITNGRVALGSLMDTFFSFDYNYLKDNEILELFNSKKINLLMSNENNDSYTFKTIGNTIFVVVHTGFTDFIIYNDLLVKNKYVQDLLDYMINVFGEDVVKEEIFRLYFSLRITQNIRK